MSEEAVYFVWGHEEVHGPLVVEKCVHDAAPRWMVWGKDKKTYAVTFHINVDCCGDEDPEEVGLRVIELLKLRYGDKDV